MFSATRPELQLYAIYALVALAPLMVLGAALQHPFAEATLGVVQGPVGLVPRSQPTEVRLGDSDLRTDAGTLGDSARSPTISLLEAGTRRLKAATSTDGDGIAVESAGGKHDP